MKTIVMQKIMRIVLIELSNYIQLINQGTITMYESMFNPTTLVISCAIYLLLLLSVVLAVKLLKVEKENRKQMNYILYLNDRLTKLEENETK